MESGWHKDPTGKYDRRYYNNTSGWTSSVVDASGNQYDDPIITSFQSPAATQATTQKKQWSTKALVLTSLAIAFTSCVGGAAIRASNEVPTEADLAAQAETKTETKTKEVTPQACLTALELAAKVIGLSADTINVEAEALSLAGTALQAVSDSDVATLRRIKPQIDAKTAQIQSNNAELDEIKPKLLDATSECKSKSNG